MFKFHLIYGSVIVLLILLFLFILVFTNKESVRSGYFNGVNDGVSGCMTLRDCDIYAGAKYIEGYQRCMREYGKKDFK